MRRANAQRQSDRRAEILDAAQRCFARSGFHRASMQDICAEAGMSPGNLYRYFPSKEALIAGICERDRAEVAQRVRQRRSLARTSSRCSKAWRVTISSSAPTSRSKLCTEIMAESRRHPEIARISAAFDTDIEEWLVGMLQARRRARRIPRRPRLRRGRHHADGDRRRHVVAPRGRSGLRRRKRCCRSSWMSRGTCCASRAHKRGAPKEGKS